MQCSACQEVFEFHSELQKEENFSPLPPDDAVLSINTQTERIVVKTHEPEVPQKPSSFQKPVLPEAFRPVVSPKGNPSVPYFWMLLCGILLLGFMAMAWLYRDLLVNRSFYVPVMPVARRIEMPKPSVVPPFPEPKIIEPIATEPEPAVVPEVPQNRLTVQSVRFRKTPTAEAVLIEGVVKNETPETLPVPEKIYALAYDSKGERLFEKEIYLPSGLLYPDMEQPFFGTYTPATEEIQWVDVVLEK